MLYAIFGVLALILDQWVKYWTAGNLVYGAEAKEFIPGLLNLINVHNTGAAFSFLSGANAGKFFIILAVAFAVIIILGLATNFISGKLARWSAVFVAAGGIGNAIDRALYGYVQDMFQFDFAKNFPVFNVADIFICVFCFIFILCIIFGKDKGAEEDYVPEELYDKPARGRKAARYEDDYEEEAPRKASKRSRYEDDYEEEAPRKSSKRSRYEDDYEEEAPRKTAKRSRYEDEYEEEAPRKATRARAAEPEKEPVRTTVRARAVSSEDEFERLYAAPQGRQKQTQQPAAPAVDARRTAKPATTEDPFAAWEKANAAMSAERSAPAAKPAAPARPAAERTAAPAPKAPAAAPAPKKSSDDFDLDDILAEFK